MASLICTIEADEFLGLSALTELDRAAYGGDANSGTATNAVSTAKVLLRTALAGKLQEAGLPWAPPAEAANKRAAEEREPPGAMRRIMGNDMARKGAASVMAAALVVVLWGGYIGGWQWTGFRDNDQMWAWLTLLLLPVVLGTIPLWIQAKDYIGKGRRVLYAVIIAAWTGFMIASYLVPLKWTGFPGKKLWDWLGLLVLPAAVVTTTTLISMRGRRPKAWLRPYQKAIIAALAAGWVVTVIGGYALGWKWTGYAGKAFWDWLEEFLPLVFPITLLPPLVRWVSGNAAGRARAAHAAAVARTAESNAAGRASAAQEAAVPRTATGGAVWVNESVSQQGLWSVPGHGVLARQGDLILLSAIDERGLVEKLLDSLVTTSQGGGDGRRLADAVEDLVESDVTWDSAHGGQPEPAVIAIGPASAGFAVTVSGTAWAEIATARGTNRLVAGQPATVLRCVVGAPVHAIRGGLGTGRGGGDHTDHFSRLERGTVRAGGLSYHCGLPAAPPQGWAAPKAIAPLAHAVAAPDGANPDWAADAGAAEAGQRPCPVDPPPMQPDVAQFHKTEPEMAEPATADFEAAEPGTAGPVAMESAAPPQADPVHPATEKIQVPHFGAAAAAAPSDAPVVLDMHCENHHFGDPEARSRAFCGVWKNRPGSILETGPRPPLGALVLDDNSVLQLTADCVVGRDPALDPSVAAGQARPLCILDAQVSRIHARVHLDGWQVSLIDLGSTNGTRIRPPGKRSEQTLEPNVPVLLQSGTRVFVGTEGFRYECHRGR